MGGDLNEKLYILHLPGLTFEYKYDTPSDTLMDDFHVTLGYGFEFEDRSYRKGDAKSLKKSIKS